LLVDSTLSIAFTVSLFYGVGAYLAAKVDPHVDAVVVFGLGWIVILLLKDHAKDGRSLHPKSISASDSRPAAERENGDDSQA